MRTDEALQGIPLQVRRSLEATLASFYLRHYRTGHIDFVQMDEIGDERWRVLVRLAYPGGEHQSSGQQPVAQQHTTAAYLVQVLRTIGRRREFGLLRCMEVVRTSELQMNVALDGQIQQLHSGHASSWGRGSSAARCFSDEVRASDLVFTGCFSPEDRLWTIRSLVAPDNATVGGVQALVLLHGRTLSLVPNWSVIFDKVFARQRQDLQRALDLAIEQARGWRLPDGHLSSGTRVTLLRSLDHQALAALAQVGERGWEIHLQLRFEDQGMLPQRLQAPWGGVELVVLVLHTAGRTLKTIGFNPQEIDLIGTVQASLSHAHKGGEV